MKAIEIGSRVRIKDADCTGVVTGIMLEQEGTSYRIAYWADGARRHEWVYGFEIALDTTNA